LSNLDHLLAGDAEGIKVGFGTAAHTIERITVLKLERCNSNRCQELAGAGVRQMLTNHG